MLSGEQILSEESCLQELSEEERVDPALTKLGRSFHY